MALRDGSIDAIVADAPVLEYYAHTHPEERVDVIGGSSSRTSMASGLRATVP